MMDKIQHHLAKQLVHRLDNTDELANYSQLSIKLASEEKYLRALNSYRMAGSFAEAVPFVVRDERRHKCVVLRAELEFGKGLVLSGAGVGAPAIMRLTFADKSEDVLGKVQHANTATLYKIHTTAVAGEFEVRKADEQRTVVLRISKQQNPVFGLLKRMYTDVMIDDCVTKICDTSGMRVGRITCRTLVPRVHIAHNCTDNEHRALVVAVGLLQTLPICYPDLFRLFLLTKNKC